MNPRPFEEQVAVVTGASSGIGKEIALSLAENGAEVCLVGRRREALQEVAEQVCQGGARAHVCRVDLTREEEIQALAHCVEREFDKVDVLILCGGAIVHGPVETTSLKDFDLQYYSNLRAHYALTQFML